MKPPPHSDAEVYAPPSPDPQSYPQHHPPSQPTQQQRPQPSAAAAHPGALLQPQQEQQPWAQPGPPRTSQGLDLEGEASSASSAPTGTLPLLEERSKRHMRQLEAFLHHKSPRLADSKGPLPSLRTPPDEATPVLQAATDAGGHAGCEPVGTAGDAEGEEPAAAWPGSGRGATAPAPTLMTLGARLNRTAGLQPVAAARPAAEPQPAPHLDDCASSGTVRAGQGELPPPGEDPFWDDIRRIFNM
ncbi:hypothetical protein HYH03_018572 [Edaphochlamys debaryana]|uniref:Uncharacterized protein n=1 Tax=Edaphochlamys debaryana TaxID=47281 RepID=A0A835XK01_9CHLO|nr:hypothetical protein HYH03_018570 [Edaphochlamys debaryana]KAG2482496.1 hypothetical protein HYH03_018571 [Edaphochlamys debaryana]KAG2482497.1 hypothetical protein HYH03_018572 [Edaphochlamys debaryana]|eukprot:KAG2482495.1 hypothetical protein HYH03_018570 [Edaphochlamys debaryana]